ncbi:zinc-binding dehydrogenase [Pseudonocardia sp. GCM10023141]|uniref:zinc-binding dehydrogenase n=1 Tax=Pseudonocardia sp. GCM10023141 TaxID=3252653 RepID=UPI00361E2328
MSGVVRLYEHGGPEVLRFEDETVGEPAAGQVRLRQEAIGVNFVDTYFRTGTFPTGPLPTVIGGEGAGTVDAVGPEVDGVALGDRVGYYFTPGAYAETRLIAAADLIPLPADVPAPDAVALLAKGLTAWGRLRRVHAVQPGETVLVTGATGGVGSLLAPWAQHLGATVIGLVASADRAAAARALGLENVVVAGTGELATTAAGGVDVLYDAVGQATFAEAVAVLRDGATLDLLGAASGPPDLDTADLERRRIAVTQTPTFTHLPDRATLLDAADEVFRAWRDGVFGKREVRTYRLDEAAQAHRDLEARVPGAAIVLLPGRA